MVFWSLILLGVLAVAFLAMVTARTRPSSRPGLRVFLAAGLVTMAWLGGVLLNTDDQMRRVSFCERCHEMRPYIESVRGQSASLAASHHRSARVDTERACYTCHTRPGLEGFIEAKLTGLHDLKVHYLGTIPDKLSLKREYDVRVCLKCHAASDSFGAQSAHDAFMDSIESGELSCVSCHGPAHDVGD